MGLLIRQSGILTTIQDLGRFGYGRFGINPGGAMDRRAVRLINTLLGNDEDAAVVEMHFPAARVVFEKPCVFAIAGAQFSPALDGHPIENWRQYEIDAGSELNFTERKVGNRAYLAVGGGLLADEWLGSVSTNLVAKVGGFNGRKLESGDLIQFQGSDPQASGNARAISRSLIPPYSGFPTLRVTKGIEYHLLDDRSKELLSSSTFSIANESGRMALRTQGPRLSMSRPTDMISSAVGIGTLQLLPDGQLIVLMADHQTTGGYPRIAHIAERDLAVAGQLAGGDKAAFEVIDRLESERLNSEIERNMAIFRAGCRLGAAG